MKRFKYKTFCFVNPSEGTVTELYLGAKKPYTPLDALGEDGWEIVGCEYIGTKAAGGGALRSESIWIAKKEI